MGLTGYDWGSKPEEVTDGLSNTIYLMQTPPGLQQPWIAGGGAVPLIGGAAAWIAAGIILLLLRPLTGVRGSGAATRLRSIVD